ncbi:MAG: helix-turn-helix transcriptional regulator [Chloroflexi bacterium]|nr:helix-turn-helix transcriptional regulator [Chloroflexota bacterium]
MTSSRWARPREQVLDTPELRADDEQTKRSLILTREILRQLDALRKSSGLSKEGLAKRAGLDPTSVRRLFAAETSNPTLRTLVDVMAALDVEIELKLKQPPHQPDEAAYGT